jgi:hypothetical protein
VKYSTSPSTAQKLNEGQLIRGNAFAGNRFRIRILSGVSAGELLGGFSCHFQLVDVDNKRSAEYRSTAAIGPPAVVRPGRHGTGVHRLSGRPLLVVVGSLGSAPVTSQRQTT